ncbi:MAG TPA: VWA domain-containing protein, partial [Fimbriimonas sp.]|nr:VWA domain-containing protein [Fimbriimonas sp.]
GRHMLAEVDGVTKLDHVLDALLMLTHAALAAGDSVGLLVYSDTVKRYIPPRKGRSQAGLIIEAIHDLVPEPVESDPGAAFAYLASRWTRRSLLVGFTDYEDVDRARDLLKAFKPMSRRHLAVIVRVQDPRLDEVLQAPVEHTKQMYQRAAAAMLMEDRLAARALLLASGVHNLESEPQDLAAKLVNYYVMVKERSLL